MPPKDPKKHLQELDSDYSGGPSPKRQATKKVPVARGNRTAARLATNIVKNISASDIENSGDRFVGVERPVQGKSKARMIHVPYAFMI
jgi:hypothetical protein